MMGYHPGSAGVVTGLVPTLVRQIAGEAPETVINSRCRPGRIE